MIRPCKRIAQLLLESLHLKHWTRIGAMNKNTAGARTPRPRIPPSRFARTRRPRSAGWLMQRSQSWFSGWGHRPGLTSARKFGKFRWRAMRRRQFDMRALCRCGLS